MSTVRSALQRSRTEGPGRGGAGSLAVWLVPGCYLAAAVALTWRLWSDPSGATQLVNQQDNNLIAWFMRLSATAVAHGRLPPLVTTAMNAPHGISMMWNVSLLLPATVLAPVTLLAGPQAAITTLLTLGFAGSATSLYFVLRRWGASVSAAALGGAVYGFSPALLGSAMGHYQLQFAVFPPLIIDAFLRIITGRSTRLRTGVLLGVACAAQIFIGEELLADTAVAAAIFAVALIVSHPRAVLRRARGAVPPVATAALVAVVITAYPLWVQFAGPLAEHGSPWSTSFFIAHLPVFVTPSRLMLFHTAASAASAAAYPEFLPEYLAYLGFPLLVVLAIATARFWRDARVAIAAFAFAVLELFSLGDGGAAAMRHPPSQLMLLPWYWLEHLPMLSDVLPDRFAILADGAAAVVLAFSLDLARAQVPRTAAWARRGIAAVAVAAVLPLVPLPLQTAQVSPVPPGWRTTFARLHLTSSARVLVVPVPWNLLAQPLRWQADTGEPGTLIGGYFIAPNHQGLATSSALLRRPTAKYLDALWTGGKHRVKPTPAQVRADLSYWRPDAVVAVAGRSSPVGRYLISIFGNPSVAAGQVLGWRL